MHIKVRKFLSFFAYFLGLTGPVLLVLARTAKGRIVLSWILKDRKLAGPYQVLSLRTQKNRVLLISSTYTKFDGNPI